MNSSINKNLPKINKGNFSRRIPSFSSSRKKTKMSAVYWVLGTVAVLVISTFLWVRWLRIKNLGDLDITTASVAYDEATFGHVLTWDKHCFYLHGKPIWLVSGEFHYWRIPDKERWKSVLLQYKAAGLNCIRIYYCWAYHSPGRWP